MRDGVLNQRATCMVDRSTPAFLGSCQFGPLLLTDVSVPSLNFLAEEMAFVSFVGRAVKA